MSTSKRVFFGMPAIAPWLPNLPSGKIITEENRHLTLAFLGNVDYPSLEMLLPQFPVPPFKMSPIGIFNECLFLPKRHPHVVSWHVLFFNDTLNLIQQYYKTLHEWLRSNQFPIENRHTLLPHVSITRSPFISKEWEKEFIKLPVFFSNIHLYESLGHSKYKKLWSYPLQLPFEEIDHTADIAFNIYGENQHQLFLNALIALCFKFPPLIDYIENIEHKSDELNTDAIVNSLNDLISIADGEIGCPFKAISWHGKPLTKLKPLHEHSLFSWEMIIDV